MNTGPAILLGLAIAAIGALSGFKAKGPCVYTRERRTSYQCTDAGQVEHYRIEPTQQ